MIVIILLFIIFLFGIKVQIGDFTFETIGILKQLKKWKNEQRIIKKD